MYTDSTFALFASAIVNLLHFKMISRTALYEIMNPDIESLDQIPGSKSTILSSAPTFREMTCLENSGCRDQPYQNPHTEDPFPKIHFRNALAAPG